MACCPAIRDSPNSPDFLDRQAAGGLESLLLAIVMRKWLSGRASPCQGEGRGFESRLPLQIPGVGYRQWKSARCASEPSGSLVFPLTTHGSIGTPTSQLISTHNYKHSILPAGRRRLRQNRGRGGTADATVLNIVGGDPVRVRVPPPAPIDVCVTMDFRMIDLHLHLLPGIDDGSQTMDESREMLKSYAAMGFTRLVATPHLMEPLTPDYYRQALQLLVQVRPVAAEFGIQLDLGFEHMLDSDTASRLQHGEPSTLAESRAVLVELPFVGWPQHTGTALFNMRTAGYRPVLAHPERYIDAQKNPDLVLDAALQGAVIQITTGSLVGLYGKESARLAHTLLRDSIDRGLPLLFATDAHSNGNRLTTVPGGLEWVERNVPMGKLVNEWAALAVPEALLADETPPAFGTWLANQDQSRVAEATQKAGDASASGAGARPLSKVLSRLSRSRS